MRYYKKFFVFVLFFVFLTFSPNVVFATGWTNQGNLAWTQGGHKAVLLTSGNVLIAGGEYWTLGTNHTQIYNTSTGTWAGKTDMTTERNFLTLDLVTVNATTGATKVLAVGGVSASCSCVRNSAELYDENSNTWTSTPNMSQARWAHASSILSDGTVLVTGGSSNTSGTTKLSSVELYNPLTDTWTTKQSLGTARFSHKQITFLDSSGNEKVMIIGGNSSSSNAINSVEIYDPSTNSWSSGPSLSYGRNNFSAVLLNDGRILVVGGDSPNFTKSEIYDPTTNTWTTYTTPYTSKGPATVVLGSGANYNVLAAGSTNYSSNAMLFNPSTNSWSTTTSMNVIRGYSTLTLLSNGDALAAGGRNTGGNLNSSETYTP